jgi:hypothetical protein
VVPTPTVWAKATDEKSAVKAVEAMMIFNFIIPLLLLRIIFFGFGCLISGSEILVPVNLTVG